MQKLKKRNFYAEQGRKYLNGLAPLIYKRIIKHLAAKISDRFTPPFPTRSDKVQNYIDNQRLGEFVEEHSTRDKSLNFTSLSHSSCDSSVLHNKYFRFF